MKLAFIGVGSIGRPMAEQLRAAGHELIVHDLRREAAASLVAAGAAWADSPRAAAIGCAVVATCLPGPVEMERVTVGPDGILDAMASGAVYIDHTTNSPAVVRNVHDRFRSKGVAMLGAVTRDLLVMVGGERAIFDRVRPLLDTIAKRVLYTGAIGCGSISKLMHNAASFTLDLLMAECWTAGVKAGVAPETIVEVFKNALRD